MNDNQSLEWVWTQPLDAAICGVVHELKAYIETIRTSSRVIGVYIVQGECRDLVQEIEKQCDQVLYHLDILFNLGYQLSTKHSDPLLTTIEDNVVIQQEEGEGDYHHISDTDFLRIVNSIQESAALIRTLVERFYASCYSHILHNVQEIFRMIEQNIDRFLLNLNIMCVDILLVRVQKE